MTGSEKSLRAFEPNVFYYNEIHWEATTNCEGPLARQTKTAVNWSNQIKKGVDESNVAALAPGSQLRRRPGRKTAQRNTTVLMLVNSFRPTLEHSRP